MQVAISFESLLFLTTAAASYISGALMEKLEYNNSRADHKPENRKIEGGKKF